MKSYTCWSSIVVAVLGVACLVLGIIFIVQAGSAEQRIADEIQPLTIAEVDAQYEAVKANQTAMAAAEEPGIQAGTAAPSATYNYLTIQLLLLNRLRTRSQKDIILQVHRFLRVVY